MKNSRQLMRKLLITSLISIFVLVGTFPGQVNADPLTLTEEAPSTLTDQASLNPEKPLRQRLTQRLTQRLERLGLPAGTDLRALPTGGGFKASTNTCPTAVTGQELKNPEEWARTETNRLTANKVKPFITLGQTFDNAFLYQKDDETPTYIPPTIKVQPGETINLTLTNKLNDYTNFHYHGFQVSPQDGSDNVLKKVPPMESYPMTVNVDPQHQPGLDWYHPHYHGNTSNQVGKGMAGLIIVEGMEGHHSMVDGIPQKLMLFKGLGQLQVNGSSPYNCFTVNGQVQPNITIQPGGSQFWRMANADSGIYLNLVLAKVDGDQYVPQPLDVLGLDGYPTQQVLKKKSILLPPGSRAEVLVGDLEAGATYHLISLKQRETLNYNSETSEMYDDPFYKTNINNESFDITEERIDYSPIATVNKSTGEPVEYDFSPYTNYSEYITNQTQEEDHWLLPTPEELISEQDVVDRTGEPFLFQSIACQNPEDDPRGRCPDDSAPGNIQYLFLINDEIYNGEETEAVDVHAGTIEDWKLTNDTEDLHTFHIHQTHFVVIKDTEGNRPSVLTYRDNIDLPKKSSVTVRIPFTNTGIVTGGEDLVGKFVFHCHVLGHEDSGMMREVHVYNENGPDPGPAPIDP